MSEVVAKMSDRKNCRMTCDLWRSDAIIPSTDHSAQAMYQVESYKIIVLMCCVTKKIISYFGARFAFFS